GAMDAGGGPEAAGLHRAARPRLLALATLQGRAAAVRQELPTPVDELPPAGHQEGQVQPAGGEVVHLEYLHVTLVARYQTLYIQYNFFIFCMNFALLATFILW
ncbi:hypothetical protein EE612_023761, partial [Oryza sativa]